jgi:N-acetylneuraminic acid mutarotase
MPAVREGETATLLGNGQVLVAGGDDGTNLSTSGPNIYSSAELYNPVSNTWSSAGSMAAPREGQTATLLANGKVLVLGGEDDNLSGQGYHYTSTAELYDPVSNTWSSAGSMATSRLYHTATLLSNGEVLITGGQSGGPFGATLSSAELYDPVGNSWSAAASMATARKGHVATLLPKSVRKK